MADLKLATMRASAAAASKKGVRCPVCDGPAVQLPKGVGVDEVAEAERFSFCGIHWGIDGMVSCSLEARMEAGLLRALGAIAGTDLPAPKSLASGPQRLVLPFVRAARRHPQVGEDLALLLLDGLKEVRLDRADSDQPPPGQFACQLQLEFRYVGTISALLDRHRDELRTLVASLLGGGALLALRWDPAGQNWQGERVLPLAGVRLSDHNHEIDLAWPDMAVLNGSQPALHPVAPIHAGLTTASAGSSKRWEQPQLTLVPTEGQAASCATPPATEPAADVQPTAVTYGSFAGGCVGCDRAYGGQLINSENPDAPRRSWTELQQWYPQLKTVAGASPAASLRRMGVPFRRRGRTGPVLFSDLAAAICTIELGLPCVGLPGEYALRQRLLAPPDQADQAS